MPRNYQRKKANPYQIPGTLYDYVISCVRFTAPFMTDPGRITEQTQTIQREVKIIIRDLEEIPKDYQTAVLDSIISEKAFPKDLNKRQLSTIKAYIIFKIAKDLYLI